MGTCCLGRVTWLREVLRLQEQIWTLIGELKSSLMRLSEAVSKSFKKFQKVHAISQRVLHHRK